MKTKLICVLAIILVLNFSGFAQVDDLETTPIPETNVTEKPSYKKNAVKLNLTSLLMKNYGLQYERILTKNISAAISGRYMPTTSIPFKSFIKDKVGDGDPDTEKMIDQVKLGNYALTPEVKFYLGKGYGQGFYISLFYRYSHYESSGIPIDFTSDLGEDRTLDLSGQLSANTGGFLLGLQKNIGKSLNIDFWFLGPHIGSGNGNFTGTPSSPLSANEQQEIRDVLEDMDLPIVNTRVEVDANNATLKVNGPWAGLRIGLSLGIRF